MIASAHLNRFAPAATRATNCSIARNSRSATWMIDRTFASVVLHIFRRLSSRPTRQTKESSSGAEDRIRATRLLTGCRPGVGAELVLRRAKGGARIDWERREPGVANDRGREPVSRDRASV